LLHSIGNDHPIGPANQFYAADLPQNDYDPEKAKSLLKKAGLDGLKVDLSAANAAFSGAIDAAQLYQASAKEAGIEINVVQEPDDGYWSNVWLKKPWCACYWSGRATEDWMFSTAYESGVPWNDTFWENARFQELLLTARAEHSCSDVRKLRRCTLNQAEARRSRGQQLPDGWVPPVRTLVVRRISINT